MKDNNKIQNLVGVLRECETQEQVEETFNRFGMADFGGKTAHLTHCMGNPLMFFGGKESAATKYATVLSMFLTGEWKKLMRSETICELEAYDMDAYGGEEE